MDISDPTMLDDSAVTITDIRLVSWRDNGFDPATDEVPISLMQAVAPIPVNQRGREELKPVSHPAYDDAKPSGWGLALRENQTVNRALQDSLLGDLAMFRDTGSVTL